MERIDIATLGKFGRLKIIGIAPYKRDRRVLCACDCGKLTDVLLGSLRSGRTISCGCYNRENRKNINFKHGHNTRSRGVSSTYTSWSGMIRRCYSESDHSYPRYGGRGITVCKRWRESFSNFLDDMGQKPAGLSLDRIDNSGNYEPKNCRWATVNQQANNKRNNRLLTYRGETLNLTQWQEKTGIHRDTLLSRIKRGCTAEEALTNKSYQRKR